MKRFKSIVLSSVVAASLVFSASSALAHPYVNLHSYSSLSLYKTALDQQFSIDASTAFDQFEMDFLYKQYYADVATATVYFNGQGFGTPRLSLIGYSSYSSYKAELDRLLSIDWQQAFDQFELDRILAQYYADIDAAKIYFGV